MYSDRSTRALPRVSFLIRRSRDQRSVSTSPGLIAAAHVLHRLLAPRHPPCALVLLIRKEHVDVAMEFSRCARVDRARAVCGPVPASEPRPSRRPHPLEAGSVLQSSTACGRGSPDGDPHHVNEVDVVLGESDHRTSKGTSPTASTSRTASGVRAPDSLERR